MRAPAREPISGGGQLPSSPWVGAAVSLETLGLLWNAGAPRSFQGSVATPSGCQLLLQLRRHGLIRGFIDLTLEPY